MLSDAVRLIASGLVTTKLWATAVLSFLGTFTLSVFLDNILFPTPSAVTYFLVFAVLTGFVGVLVVSWRLTRSLADPKTEERGFFGSWLGWGIVGGMPCIFAMVVFGIWDDAAAFWWLESLAVSVATCLAAPIFVHASGRAINDNGPSLGYICDYWLDNFRRLFVAYFVATAPLTMVTDALYKFGNSSQTSAILSSVVSTAAFLATTLISIAITVIAYREAEAARPVAAA